MAELLKLTGDPLALVAHYRQARDFRTLPWPSSDLIYPMGRGEDIVSFQDAFNAVRRNYKPYIGVLPGQHVMSALKDNGAFFGGPVTFIPMEPDGELPIFNTAVTSAKEWFDRYDQKGFFHVYGPEQSIGFLGLHFLNFPHMQYWYGHRVVVSDCLIDNCYADWIYGGKGPDVPEVIVVNSEYQTIHNWTREYAGIQEPKKGGSGPLYISADGQGYVAPFFLFMRNYVRHVTGAVHISAEDGGVVRNGYIMNNLFFNAAIGTSIEGNAEKLMVANNAFLYPREGPESIMSHCENFWDISGGTDWLSWGTEDSIYQNNYVASGVANRRHLWMSAATKEKLRSNIARGNVIDYAPGAYACYGVGPTGGSVLDKKLLLGRDIIPFYDSSNTLRTNPIERELSDLNWIDVEAFMALRLAEYPGVGPDVTELGRCHQWNPDGGTPPGGNGGETPPITDLKERLIAIEQAIKDVPRETVRLLADWYKR